MECIFLDFAKAFDKASHNLLFSKMNKLNMHTNVFIFINVSVGMAAQHGA